MHEQMPESLSEQIPEPYTNQQKDNISFPETFLNNQESNGKLLESLTNNPEDKQKNIDFKKEDSKSLKPPKCVIVLNIIAVFIVFIETFLNLAFVRSDILNNGIYGAGEKVGKYLFIMFLFGFPCLFLICVLIHLSQIINNIKNTLRQFFILLAIKIGLFAIYFIFLLLDRDNKEIRLITLIPEIAVNAIIVINKKLCINYQKKQNQNQ